MKKLYHLILIIVFTPEFLNAQDIPSLDSTNELSSVVISYKADRLTPITYQNLDSKEIDLKSTGQEASFILAETPSVTTYSDAGNSQGYSYFRLRGIDQTRINITLDGIPLNEPEDQGAYFSNYPDLLNSVSNLQIQRGVGTTKNGAASYGGSVQLFSPNLSDSNKTTVGSGYGSFNSYRAFGEYNSGVRRHSAFYARASQIHSDGYKYSSSNNSQSVFLSGALFYEKSTWKVNVLVGQQQNKLAWIGVSDSLIGIDRRINANSKQEKDKFVQGLAQILNSRQINSSVSMQTSIYSTLLKGNYDFDLNNFSGLPSSEELYNYAVQSNLTGFNSNFSYLKKRFKWTTGLHGNSYKRQHTGSEKLLGQLYQNTGYKKEASFFTKAIYTIKRLTLFADVQYRYVDFDYKGTVAFQKMKWSFINPKAGVSFALQPSALLYYSIGSTGREPTRNDLFGGNDNLTADSFGHAVLYNTSPEYVLNHELGIRIQQKKLVFNLNFYYMGFKNEIVLDGKFGPNGLALTNNVEQSLRSGIELNLEYKMNRNFSLVNNSSFNYSRIKEQNETFSPILTPPVIINQELVYRHTHFTIALSGRYQHKSFIDFANSAFVKSYFLVNSRASFNINAFQFSLFANNLTNTRYFNQAYIDIDGSKKYFVQSPLNFYASIQYSF